MLFPDMPRGLAEMGRVVRPGRVLVTAFGDPGEVEFIGLLMGAVRAVVQAFEPPLDPPPLPFQLRDPARLRRELSAPGSRTSASRRSPRRSASARRRPSEVREALLVMAAGRASADGTIVLTNPVSTGVGPRPLRTRAHSSLSRKAQTGRPSRPGPPAESS